MQLSSPLWETRTSIITSRSRPPLVSRLRAAHLMTAKCQTHNTAGAARTENKEMLTEKEKGEVLVFLQVV